MHLWSKPQVHNSIGLSRPRSRTPVEPDCWRQLGPELLPTAAAVRSGYSSPLRGHLWRAIAVGRVAIRGKGKHSIHFSPWQPRSYVTLQKNFAPTALVSLNIEMLARLETDYLLVTPSKTPEICLATHGAVAYLDNIHIFYSPFHSQHFLWLL